MVVKRRICQGLPPLPRAADKETENTGKRGDSSRTASQTRTASTTTALPPSVADAALPVTRVTSASQLSHRQESLSGVAVGKDVMAATVEAPTDHFLKGIQLERCDNVLSIPDPPSPLVGIGMDYVGRRHSVSVLDSRPLREISNASDVEEEEMSDGMRSSNKNDHRNVTSRRESRRSKRKTINNSQSPLVLVPHSDQQVNSYTTPPIHAAAKPGRSQQLPSSKRRKKRQSIILPSDVEPAEQNCDEFTKTYATFKNETSPPPTPANETKTPTKPPIDDLHELRQLVHAFTAIPQIERSARSAPALEILARTGYPIGLSVPMEASGAISQPGADPSREQKFTFFAKLGPQLKQMDACKISDAKMVEEVTRCRSEKVRGGFYRYVRIETGRPVSEEEFQDRYLMMLEEVNHIRSQAWLEYFDALRDKKKSVRGTGDAMSTASSGESSSQVTRPPPEKNLLLPAAQVPQGQSQATCTTSHEDNAKQDNIETEEMTNERVLETDQVEMVEASCGKQSVVTTTPIPIPDRDMESNDPIIAQAERKLWDAIDKALAEYSRDVLAAQSATATTTAPPNPSHTPVPC